MGSVWFTTAHLDEELGLHDEFLPEKRFCEITNVLLSQGYFFKNGVKNYRGKNTEYKSAQRKRIGYFYKDFRYKFFVSENTNNGEKEYRISGSFSGNPNFLIKIINDFEQSSGVKLDIIR